jgi:hypothetical protein
MKLPPRWMTPDGRPPFSYLRRAGAGDCTLVKSTVMVGVLARDVKWGLEQDPVRWFGQGRPGNPIGRTVQGPFSHFCSGAVARDEHRMVARSALSKRTPPECRI